jgi:hypothetical protein
VTDPHESPPTPASQVDDALGASDEPPGASTTGPAARGKHAAPAAPHDAPPTAGSRVDDDLGASDEPGRAPPGEADTEAMETEGDEPQLPDTEGGTPSSPLIWRGMWHVPRYRGRRFWEAWVTRAAILLVGVLLLATAFIAAYVGGLHEPAARDIPVGVVSGDQNAEQVLTLLDQRTDLIVGREYANATDAHTALDRREIFAVLASDGNGLHLTTSSGAGQGTAEVVAGAVGAVADATGMALTTTDAHPLTENDPRGLVAFYLVVGLSVGGYLAATVLGLSLGTAPRDLDRAAARFGAFAAFALVLGFIGALLVGPVFDIWSGHLLGATLGGALIVFTAAAITSALQGWLGLVGTGLAILLLVVLGNPGSGGVFPWPFLPSFFRSMHLWVPTGLGTDLVRAVAYYHRAAIAWPVTFLLLWSILGILGTLAATVVRGQRGERAL